MGTETMDDIERDKMKKIEFSTCKIVILMSINAIQPGSEGGLIRE